MKQKTRTRRRWRSATVFATAAVTTGALAAAPASAEVVDVADGHNVGVFHSIDMIAAFSWAAGEEVTVNVLRDGVLIGAETGPAVEGPDGVGIEINHGPEGAAVDGDCWEGQTPDILPGDVIQATNGTDTDEVIVDDLGFTGEPFLAPNGDVLLDGVARTSAGVAIPPSALDSAEFRDGSRFRVFANEIRVTRRPDEEGGFRLRYNPHRNFERNRDNLTPAQIRQTLLTVDGHMIGFGHTEPLPLETQLAEGLGDAPGPAPGCAGSSAQWGVNRVAPGAVNRSTLAGGLTVNGVAHNATAVRVELSDGTNTVSTQATGTANWSATFTRSQLQRLDDAELTVNGLYTVPALVEGGEGGEITGKTRVVLKDLIRPTAPRATPGAGAHRGTQRVRLRAPGGDDIRWTLGNGRQAAPTATRGNLYTGPIAITADQVLKARAVDAAGNVSPILRQRYRIGDAPSRPRIGRASSGAAGGKATAGTRWRAPLVTNGRIQGYRVTALKLRPNGSVASRKVSRLLRPKARSAQMRLARGSYRFRVHAVNPFGKSRLSVRSNRVRSR